MRWRIFRLKLWIQQRMKIWNKTFANVGSLCLDLHQKSALQSTEPQKCFYSSESEQKPSAISVLEFQGIVLQPCQSLSLESWFCPCLKHTHTSPCIYLPLQQWDSQTTAGLCEKYIGLGRNTKIPMHICLFQFLCHSETFLDKDQVFWNISDPWTIP